VTWEPRLEPPPQAPAPRAAVKAPRPAPAPLPPTPVLSVEPARQAVESAPVVPAAPPQAATPPQIAARLALSEKTVRNHITSVFAKLEVENRSQAIVLARGAGFGKSPRNSPH